MVAEFHLIIGRTSLSERWVRAWDIDGRRMGETGRGSGLREATETSLSLSTKAWEPESPAGVIGASSFQ
jgi:hypothetical protein